MTEFLEDSLFAGVTISLLAYILGYFIKKKFKLGFLNPLLISIAATIVVLVVADVDYEVYNKGASFISWFLTPATVCLAIPLYEQWQLLKDNFNRRVIWNCIRCYHKSCHGICACQAHGANT